MFNNCFCWSVIFIHVYSHFYFRFYNIFSFNLVDNLTDPCLEHLKKEKFEYDQFCMKFTSIRKAASVSINLFIFTYIRDQARRAKMFIGVW